MAAPAPTRDRLLDAARDAVLRGDWARTRMADVAAAAGVSRQTLYNEFGAKDALAAALALREAERFVQATDTLLHEAGAVAPDTLVALGVRSILERAADDPLVKAVLTDDAGMLPFLTTRAEPLLGTFRPQFAAHLLRVAPGLDPVAVDLAAEAVVRLTVSYLVLPSDAADATAEAVAARIARLIRPLLGSAS